MNNSPNLSRPDAELLPNVAIAECGSSPKVSNPNDIILGEFMHAVKFPSERRGFKAENCESMPHVVGARHYLQIVKAIISLYAIFVINVHPVRDRTDKGFNYEPMRAKLPRLPVLAQIQVKISAFWVFVLFYCGSCLGLRRARKALNVALIVDSVIAFIADNISPEYPLHMVRSIA